MYEKLGNGLLRDYCYGREINLFRSLNPGKRNHGFAKGEGGGKIAKMHIIISARYKKVSC